MADGYFIQIYKMIIDSNGNYIQTPIKCLTPIGTTQIIDANYGNVQELYLGSASGDVTLIMNNMQASTSYYLHIVQGGNAINIIWPSNTQWVGGIVPTIPITPGAIHSVSISYDGNIFLNDVKRFI